MFETVRLQARTGTDGHVRIDVPTELPPGSDIEVTLSIKEHIAFDRAEWEAHVDRIAGSIPDLEAPERHPAREIEPL